MTQFEIVAHRGAHDQVPENTLPAFERAIELGADAVELDVRLTADGIPVVYHLYVNPARAIGRCQGGSPSSDTVYRECCL